jgi:hypothetical protein
MSKIAKQMISLIWIFSARLRAFLCALCLLSGKNALNRKACKEVANGLK